MANTVRILRSTTAGNVPSSLVSGQIAVNEADGRFFYRSAAGVVTPFAASPLAAYTSAANFPATGSTALLYLDQTRSRLYRWVAADSVYAEIGTVGGIDDAADGGTYA
jgi:hypothetical protein